MTDSTTYTPGEGSIAARALAHLHSVGRGVDVLSTDLATAIACDAQNLKNYLATALKHRIVRTSSMGRGKTFYCLPALDAFDADDERNGKPLQRVVDAGAAPAVQKRGQSSVFDHGIPTPPPQQLGSAKQESTREEGPFEEGTTPQVGRTHTADGARTAGHPDTPARHARRHAARALLRHV